MVLEWETYQIFCIVKNIRNSLVFNYQDKQMQAFPPKYFFEEVEEDYSLKMFLYCWKASKIYSKRLLRFINCNRIIKSTEYQKILNLLN